MLRLWCARDVCVVCVCVRHGPVGQHGAHQQPSEDVGVEDVDHRQLDHRHVSAEQGQRHEGSGADGEALTDGGRRVTGRIERVRDVAHLVGHTAHLSQTAGVVADGAVGVDGQTDGEGGQDAQGGDSDAVHVGQGVRDEDGQRQAERGDDDGLVAQRQPVDDVGGGTGGAGAGHLTDGCVRVGRVVLRHIADGQTRVQTRQHADGDVPDVKDTHINAAVGEHMGHAACTRRQVEGWV
jgi:hypothetical protein